MFRKIGARYQAAVAALFARLGKSPKPFVPVKPSD